MVSNKGIRKATVVALVKRSQDVIAALKEQARIAYQFGGDVAVYEGNGDAVGKLRLAIDKAIKEASL